MKERKTRREREMLAGNQEKKKKTKQTDQTKPNQRQQKLNKTYGKPQSWSADGLGMAFLALGSGSLWKPASCLWIVSSQASEPGGELGKPCLPRTEWGCNLTLFSAGKFSTFWSNTMLSLAKVLFLSHAMVKTTLDSRSSTVISCTSAFNLGTAWGDRPIKVIPPCILTSWSGNWWVTG